MDFVAATTRAATINRQEAALARLSTQAEARRWARLAKLTNDIEHRAFCEAQAANWYGQAARWEAQASRGEAARC